MVLLRAGDWVGCFPLACHFPGLAALVPAVLPKVAERRLVWASPHPVQAESRPSQVEFHLARAAFRRALGRPLTAHRLQMALLRRQALCRLEALRPPPKRLEPHRLPMAPCRQAREGHLRARRLS